MEDIHIKMYSQGMPTADTACVSLDTNEIRRRRVALKLSQADAAELAGFTGAQVWSDIENGRRKNITLETLEKIAGALGVKAKDLLK
jgi:transcriptional regulator with XRE-family HTH domain